MYPLEPLRRKTSEATDRITGRPGCSVRYQLRFAFPVGTSGRSAHSCRAVTQCGVSYHSNRPKWPPWVLPPNTPSASGPISSSIILVSLAVSSALRLRNWQYSGKIVFLESACAPAEIGDQPILGTWGARRESAGGLCPIMVAAFGISRTLLGGQSHAQMVGSVGVGKDGQERAQRRWPHWPERWPPGYGPSDRRTARARPARELRPHRRSGPAPGYTRCGLEGRRTRWLDEKRQITLAKSQGRSGIRKLRREAARQQPQECRSPVPHRQLLTCVHAFSTATTLVSCRAV